VKRVPPAIAVSLWHAAHPEGTPVTVTLDGGRRVATRTRSRAAVLSDRSAVVWLAGLSGCHALDRVTPRAAEAVR
jgi:hypothetical protein